MIYCDDNPSKSENEVECKKSGDNVLLPGDIGSKWFYKMWIHGIDYGDTSEYSITDTMTIEYQGKHYRCFIAKWDSDHPLINWLYYNGDNGLYLIGGYTKYDTLISPSLWIKYPVNKGDMWDHPRMVYNSIENIFYIKDTTQYSCTTSDSMFVSVNDTFIVNEYKTSPISQGDDIQAKEITHFYFSPSIGLVGKRWTSDLNQNYTKAIVKLFDYCIY